MCEFEFWYLIVFQAAISYAHSHNSINFYLMKKYIWSLCCMSLILLLYGCTNLEPIKNLNNQTAPYGLTDQQVGQAIKIAAQNQGWRVSMADEGLIQATLYWDAQHADIDISYSSSGYSIIYLSSYHLNAEDGEIDPKYNDWIYYLNLSIQNELSKMLQSTQSK